MLKDALIRGFEALVLTNAMQPMQRSKMKAALLSLNQRFGQRLQIRVSLDHYTQALHEVERGPRSWVKTITGLDWLNANGFRLALAGRTRWQEGESAARAGYARLIAERGWRIDATSPSDLVLLPEMQAQRDVPEITNRCWAILNKNPAT